MSREHDRQRQVLLDELRRLHRAEPAPAGLRRRLLARAEQGAGGLGSQRRARRTSRVGWLGELGSPRLALGALGALAMLGAAIGLRSAAIGPFTASAGDAASPPAFAVGPEPKLAAPRLPSSAPAAPGKVRRERETAFEPRDTPFDSPESIPPELRPADAEADALARAMAVRTQPCPLAELPPGAVIMPAKFGAPGLVVNTFEQQTLTCGPITRRYLEQPTPVLPVRSNAPVLIVLHDAGESAEVMRARTDRLDFERIARDNAAILIYANAAPGKATSSVANSGAWQTDPRSSLQVDDDDYLSGIIADLMRRHVIDGNNAVYLVGYGDGAAMALDAAGKRPDYAGVAAFAPPEGANVEPGRPHLGGRLSRVMLVLDTSSSRRDAMALARRWGSALGLEQKVIGHSWKSLSGKPAQPLGTLWQLDVSEPATGSNGVRLYVASGVAPSLPNALHAWDYLTGVDGADADVPDDVPDLPVDPLFVDGESVTERDAEGYSAPSLVLGEDVLPAPGAPR